MKNHKTILFAPLNWGLGHASRIIPIIEQSQKDGHTCILAGESPSIDILTKHFPELPCISLKGFSPKIDSRKNFTFQILIQLPSFFYWLCKERKDVQKIIAQQNINTIISDNRYGARNSQCKSILITHQTSPYFGKKLNFLRTPLTFALSLLINKFDECWIPDYLTNNQLSGSLSNSNFIKIPVKHIGWLSRLQLKHDTRSNLTSKFDAVLILSGPQPQQMQLEHQISNFFANQSKYKLCIIKSSKTRSSSRTISYYTNPVPELFTELISKAKLVISRSGYSSLMDLMSINKKALLIPTPGQHEQEYLAQHLKNNFQFEVIEQTELNAEHLFNRINHKL